MPQTNFQLEAETVLDSETMKIYRLMLTMNGEKYVTLKQGTSLDSARTYVDAEGSVSHCKIFLIADLMRQSKEHNLVKWYCRLEGKGVVAGGPAVLPVIGEQTLKDLLDISVKSGAFTTNTDVHLATFKGEKLILTVK